jgi:hypothetical protein
VAVGGGADELERAREAMPRAGEEEGRLKQQERKRA